MTSASRGCTGCRSNSFERDDVRCHLICSACGLIQDYDGYDAQLGGINGPEGTFVRVGTAGTGTVYTYKQRKVFGAQKLMDELIGRLGLSDSPKADHVKTMVANITEKEFGEGNWFPILIGACAYVVMRKDNKPLPIAEVASVICSDIYELGRMVARVVDFLDLKGPEKFPEFDIVWSFKRAVRNSSTLSSVESDTLEIMRKQGIFLIQCAVKWFLTTGRRPMPVVAAVLALVAELNGVNMGIEDAAKEVHANVSTSRLRYREFLEKLVKVAGVLPWGEDVTVKNVVKSAPFVIEYMERKSMEMPDSKKRKKVDGVIGVDLGDVVSECLRKDVEYGTDGYGVEGDSKCFEVEQNGGIVRAGDDDDDSDRMKLSHESLSLMYEEFLDKMRHKKSTEGSAEIRGKKRIGFKHHACMDWWNGKSDLSKKLLLKQILEKDVGLDPLPPSFVTGCRVYTRRREKINAAKARINRVMHPSRTDLGESGDSCSFDSVHAKKKRNRRQANDIDWEDFIIETLLLHEVKEEEIEKGHYNTLLDLHVFNSGVLPEVLPWKAK
ncbi:plant-specific TFIIB-related protein PTF2 [Corylus avellana]|uniref:plant-specific TFIIB-related protein PTF2 n=1 Tax=Corylus avellana TaxID=13451 RepID=UPI001E2197F6|nr:plant-specific TFIIB-related protein PTF2 [Corylus avellana]